MTDITKTDTSDTDVRAASEGSASDELDEADQEQAADESGEAEKN
jgi:hypothetical protein